MMDERLPQVPAEWFVRPDGFDASQTIHGIAHTQRVWVHAQEIAEDLSLSQNEVEALHCAALWHDIGRTNDHADYYHGAKSAGRVIGLGLHRPLGDDVREMALYAVTHHSGDEAHAERGVAWTSDPAATLRVIRVLKDADALDRVRLGGLDVSYLRFEVSGQRIERAWNLLHSIV